MKLTPANIELRPMTEKDIALGMKLKSLAKWNQLEVDWQLLLTASEGGNYIALYQEKEAGTVTTITYQHRFSWIGMVLVDPLYRGLGIGRSLLIQSMEEAKNKGTVRLDATPQGKKLYETLGFITERTLVRLEWQPPFSLPDPTKKAKPITAEVLEEIIKLDKGIFGADRGPVLMQLYKHYAPYSFYTTSNDNISGYCLGRSGSYYEQIGPLVAQHQEDAFALLLQVMYVNQQKAFIVDTFTEHGEWVESLKKIGFREQRPFIRMHLGELNFPGEVDKQYAIAGPELG